TDFLHSLKNNPQKVSSQTSPSFYKSFIKRFSRSKVIKKSYLCWECEAKYSDPLKYAMHLEDCCTKQCATIEVME
ncbi:MAG: hypothetical protein ACREBF_05125, partial [Candidatus Micrarchaeales archaeon]